MCLPPLFSRPPRKQANPGDVYAESHCQTGLVSWLEPLVPGLSGHLRRFRALKIGSSSMATPRSKHIASNVANRYVAWFKYADLLSGLVDMDHGHLRGSQFLVGNDKNVVYCRKSGRCHRRRTMARTGRQSHACRRWIRADHRVVIACRRLSEASFQHRIK